MSRHCDGPNCPGCAEERARYLDQFEPAPQPPADAATVKYSCDLHQDCVNKLAPHYNQKPAAPPVSGDGDEAVVREIATRWTMATQEIPVPGYRMKQGIVNKMIGIGMEGCAKEAYAAGLERGRALGAREEREACLNIAEDRVAAMAYRSAPRLNEAREIANMLRARRSGGQGK